LDPVAMEKTKTAFLLKIGERYAIAFKEKMFA
jgi:hypothetical protein